MSRCFCSGSPILRHCRLTDLKVLGGSTPLVLDCTVRLLAVEGAAGGVYYRNVLQSPAPLHVPAVRAASSGHPCFMGNSVTGEGMRRGHEQRLRRCLVCGLLFGARPLSWSLC